MRRESRSLNCAALILLAKICTCSFLSQIFTYMEIEAGDLPSLFLKVSRFWVQFERAESVALFFGISRTRSGFFANAH